MIERTATFASEAASGREGLVAERVLGRHDSGRPGPLVVVLGGLHGNEPAGVRAAAAVLRVLRDEDTPVEGRLVALAGNLGALREGERFLRRDLNRVWFEEEIGALRLRDPAEDDPEGREQRELLAALEAEVDGWDGPPHLLDLHTTSGGGAPFSLAADTLQNRALSEGLPIKMVLGIEEGIEGPLLSYLADRGHPALVVEGGQHLAPETEAHLIASIWIFLATTGLLASDHPQVIASRRHLLTANGGTPGVLEVVHVHRIQPGDDFQMLPGFQNFQPIEVGQVLAHDRSGQIRSPRRGRMLMPLYQHQGQDGYFLCREISRSWLRFSERCRKSGLENLLPSLPGVRRDDERPRCFLVDEDAPPTVRRVLRHFGFCKPVPSALGTLGFVRRPERDER